MALFKIFYYLTLISLLGNNSFKVRESANRQLELFGAEAMPYVDYGYRTSKDLEIRQRCYRLRIKYKWEQYNAIGNTVAKMYSGPRKKPSFYSEIKANEILKDYERIPWIDTLSVRFPNRYYMVAKYLMLAGNVPLDKDNKYPAYSKATKILVTDLIENNVKEEFVRRIVRDMYVRGKGWNGGTPLLQDTPEDNDNE